MSLTPWNRQEEWYQAMIDAAGSGGLPPVTSQDAGKVLAVDENGEWTAEDAPSGLPPITASDNGKVLTASTVTEKGAVIVPEQYHNLTSTPTVLDNTNASLFTDGAKIIYTVGAYSYEAVIESGSAYIAEQGVTITKDGNDLKATYAGGAINQLLSVNLANNSGVWVASSLYGRDRQIQIGAEKSNGAWTTNTQITPDKFFEGLFNGYDFQLYSDLNFSRMTLIVSDYDTYAVFEATTQTQERVLVTFNGFDQEYASITIEPYTTDFIVTLTPTAADYSGTMDKTVAEIDAAYKAGRKIVFHFVVEGLGSMDAAVAMVGDDGHDYPSYNSTFIETNTGALILVATLTTDDGTKQTYYTIIYTLTPAT